MTMLSSTKLWWTAFVLTISGLNASEKPVVETPYGKLRGTTLFAADFEQPALAFLGIPYAAPPIGDLRFQPTQQLKPWEGVKDVTEYGPPCPQNLDELKVVFNVEFGMEMKDMKPVSEDCLTLDVYTPDLDGSHPVMVHIHGGGLTSFMSSFDLRAYSIVEKITVVSIQYRLGALGWLNTGDDVLKGNMGFRDQVAALKWVQENIALFGGDPNKVTLIGESAGGWSVSMHILSPLSTGLFHAGIVMSGSIVSSKMAFSDRPTNDTVLTLAKFSGCPTDDIAGAVDCLRGKPAEFLYDIKKAPNYDGSVMQIGYMASLDGECFTDIPINTLRRRSYNANINVLLGVMETEGYMIAKYVVMATKSGENFSLEFFHTQVKKQLENMYPDATEEVWEAQAQAAMKVYSSATEGDLMKVDFGNFFGDIALGYPTYKLASELAGYNQGKVYFYENKYKPSMVKNPEFIPADHGYDIALVAGTQYSGTLGFADVTLSKADIKVANLIMKYWANFVKNGNPNSEEVPEWPDFNEGRFIVLDLDPVIKHNYQFSRMNFWNTVAPNLVTKETVTGPVVETKYGKVVGKSVTTKDGVRPAFAFLGIPYAAPPVGDLRWELPQTPKPWTGVKDATHYGIPCPQLRAALTDMVKVSMGLNVNPLEQISEDCLVLDIYTPALTGNRPVMVFIHGGGLSVGWSSWYDMRVYAIEHDIVGVVIQYRLNILGMMASGDGVVESNLFVYDQIASLKWVQDNIANFGGDPNQVTIFGQSAGSYSVSMLLVSPLSRGLFHRGIMESGSTIGTNIFIKPEAQFSNMQKLANHTGCPTETSKEMLECLRGVPFEQLVDTAGTGQMDPEFMMSWMPGVMNDVLPDQPHKLVDREDFPTDVELMIGFSSVEGLMLAGMFAPDMNKPDYNVSHFSQSAPMLLSFMYPTASQEKLKEVGDDLVDVHTAGRDKQGPDLVLATAEAIGDVIITAHTYKTACDVAKRGNRVYMYEFNGRPGIWKAPDFVDSDHGSELTYVFGMQHVGEFFGFPIEENLAEKEQEKMVIGYWANFARTGDPNGSGLPAWPHFSEDGKYLKFPNNPHVAENFAPERMKFYLETLPAIFEKEESTKDEL